MIERAKGQKGEAALINYAKVYKGDFQDAEVLFGDITKLK